MFRLPPDNTYHDIRKKSLEGWLQELLDHGDYGQTCGAKLAREYVQYLENEISKEKEKTGLRDVFLKKLKMENLELKRENKALLEEIEALRAAILDK